MRQPDLPINLLRNFIAIADAGTMTRAAESICLTQSALSLQMKKLAVLVGTQLFSPYRGGLVLTNSGKALLIYARGLVELNDRALETIKGGISSKPIRVGMVQDVAAPLLSSALALYLSRHPEVNLSIRMDNSQSLQAQFDAGLLDLILQLGSEEDAAAVFSTRMIWLGNPALLARPETPLALMDSPCPFREAALEALAKVGKPYRIVLETPGLAVLRTAVESGLALTCRTPEFYFAGINKLDIPGSNLDKIALLLRYNHSAPSVVLKLRSLILEELTGRSTPEPGD